MIDRPTATTEPPWGWSTEQYRQILLQQFEQSLFLLQQRAAHWREMAKDLRHPKSKKER